MRIRIVEHGSEEGTMDIDNPSVCPECKRLTNTKWVIGDYVRCVFCGCEYHIKGEAK